MPSYLGSVVHVDRPLSQFALTYQNHKLIADSLAPIALVEDNSDLYFVRPIANKIRAQSPKIGLLDVAPEIETNVTTNSYKCQNYGYIAKTAVQSEKAADVPLNIKQDAAMDCTDQLWLAREVRVASLLTTSGNYASANVQTLVGGTQWNAATGAGDIFGNFETALGLVQPAPNSKLVAWMGYAVWQQIKNHPAVLDRVKFGGNNANPALTRMQALAEVIEVDEVVVGKAWQIATNPGQANAQTRVWGKHAGIVAVPQYPSTRSLGFAQTFRWNQVGPSGVAIQTWYEPAPGLLGVNKYKVVHSDHEVIPANDAGSLILNAVA